MVPAGPERRVALHRAEPLAPEQGHDPGELRLEARHRIRRLQTGRLEVEREERGGGGPARGELLQDEGSHLQRLRHVAGEAAMVLARHHPVEAASEGEAGLVAQLGHDGPGVEFVVRVEAEGDGARGEGCRRIGGVHGRQPTTRTGHPPSP